jgi:superfamily II DNA/RNA helicase
LTVLPAEKSAPRPIGQPRTARRRDQRPTLIPAPVVTFANLGVPAPLVAALGKDGITVPFPIQAATLPDALAGFDILGRAQTGSGKTLAFGIPLAARLAGGYTMACRPRGLVLVPTRELATQVEAVSASPPSSVAPRRIRRWLPYATVPT